MSESCGRGIEGDQGTGNLNEGEVVGGDSLPADEQAAELVVPRIGSFNDPSTGFAMDASDHPSFAATTDVRNDAAPANLVLAVGVVVALVLAKVLWTPGATAAAKHRRVERGANHPLVVRVRAGDDHRQRNSSTVGQDVPFRAGFRAIGRIGAGEVPPFGAFTVALSIEHQLRSTPIFSS